MKDILTTLLLVALCVQETSLGPQHKNILKKYKVFHHDREQASRLSDGIAIIVQSGIAAREHQLKTRLEAVAATILTYKIITVCCVYLKPNHKVTLTELEDLLQQLPERYLVVSNFNAHSSFWGSEKTDPRGHVIEEFILCNNFCLLNDGKPTHCFSKSRKISCVDLSFSSPSVFINFKWDVLDNPYGSDHLPIIISLTSSPAVIPTKPRR